MAGIARHAAAEDGKEDVLPEPNSKPAAEKDGGKDTSKKKDMWQELIKIMPNSIASPTSIAGRFLQPQIEDPYLVFADIMMSGIVAPSFCILRSAPAYMPSWLADGGAVEQGLLAPTLVHGAGLALCWLLGALAGKAFEREAIDPRNFGEVLRRTLTAGAFATSVLIFATEAKLWAFSGIPPLSFGELGLGTDAIILRQTYDNFLDITSEALVMTLWRLARARADQERT